MASRTPPPAPARRSRANAQAISGTVHATAGDPAARARAEAGSLRDGLAAATGRPATVTVREREETLDVRV